MKRILIIFATLLLSTPSWATNPSRDSSYHISAAITGTGSGNIASIGSTATSGVVDVWVDNENTSAGASGTTAPSLTGNTGAGALTGTWTKIKSQINGVYCVDLWENTWSGGALATCTITISSMPTNTGFWAMGVVLAGNATGHDDVQSTTSSTQNANGPTVSSGSGDLVYGCCFYFGGPTAGPAVGTGFTIDPNINIGSMPAIATYGQFALEYKAGVSAGNVTPLWTGEGGGGTQVLITVSLNAASLVPTECFAKADAAKGNRT